MSVADDGSFIRLPDGSTRVDQREHRAEGAQLAAQELIDWLLDNPDEFTPTDRARYLDDLRAIEIRADSLSE